MNDTIKTSFWKQYGAAIDMFENAVAKCPPEIWDDERKFWYIAFHTLYFLDYYLDKNPDNFKCPQHFTMGDDDEPDRVYEKSELLDYIGRCRKKCHDLLAGFTTENIENRWKNDRREYNMFEMQLYNMRHVMHHTGQLNHFIGLIDHDLPVWVSQTKVPL